MSYAFDNSPLSTLHRNYYPGVFTTLWAGFNELVADGKIFSTREVLREIEGSNIAQLVAWAKSNPDLFPSPTADEARRGA